MAMVDPQPETAAARRALALEVEDGIPSRVLDTLIENFEIGRRIVVRAAGRMGLADWIALAQLRTGRASRIVRSLPTVLWRNGDPEIFEEIKYRDQLVHHPFDSFVSVERSSTRRRRPGRRRDQDDALSHQRQLAARRLITAAHRGKRWRSSSS
jgi:hypothetical protein